MTFLVGFLTLLSFAGAVWASGLEGVYTFVILDAEGNPLSDALITVTYQDIDFADLQARVYSGVSVEGASGSDGLAHLVLLDMGEPGLLGYDAQGGAFGPSGYKGKLIAEIRCERRGYQSITVTAGEEPPDGVEFPRLSGEGTVFRMKRSPASLLSVLWPLLAGGVVLLAVMVIPYSRRAVPIFIAVVILMLGVGLILYQNYQYKREVGLIQGEMEERAEELMDEAKSLGELLKSEGVSAYSDLLGVVLEISRNAVERFMSAWINHRGEECLALASNNLIAGYGGVDGAVAYFGKVSEQRLSAYRVESATKLRDDGEAVVVLVRVLAVWVDFGEGLLGEAHHTFEVRVTLSDGSAEIDDLLEEEPVMEFLGKEGIEDYLFEGEFDVVM